MKYLAITLLLFSTKTISAQQQDFRYHYNQSDKAYKEKDYLLFYQEIHKAHDLHPYHQVILYKTGIAAALNNLPDEAVLFLKKAVLVDAGFDLHHKDLASLNDRADFQDLILLQKELVMPIIHSDTAFVIHNRTLHAEGIAYHPRAKSFYVGSIHKRKIVRVDSTGVEHDLLASSIAGITAVFGLTVDTKLNVLWACSSPIEEMENYDAKLPSLVFKFDMTNDKLLRTYSAAPDLSGSIFGDLQLSPMGDVYVSDSKNNIILKLNEGRKSLERFFESPEFWNIQGITFSDDGAKMFIADYVKGLYQLNMKTKALSKIDCVLDVSLKGADGLNFYKGSLLAIQNGVSPLRVSRYYLNAEQTKIISFEILDRAHPAFNEPTLGTLVDDNFYYIANSQWSGYNNKHEIKPADQLQDIVILKTDLSKH